MSKKRGTYSRKFKLDAVQLADTSAKSMAQIERDLGIGEGCLRDWRKKLAAGGEDAFPGHGNLPSDQKRARQFERQLELVQQERDIRAMSNRHLLATKQMKFQFIADHRDEFPVNRMCEALEVSTSGYYAWRGRPASKAKRLV